MKLIEWEVKEDNYQEQIIIPEAQRKLAENEGISTENIRDGFEFDPLEVEPVPDIASLPFVPRFYSFTCGAKARLVRVYGLVTGSGRQG